MRFGIRELIFIVVLLAVPLAALKFLFMPRNADMKAAQEEIRVKQAQLDQLQEMVAQIPDIELELEKGRESIEEVEAKLPSEQEVDVILGQIWEAAKKNHLSIKSVKSLKPVPAANYMEQPLKVNIEGEFDGFYQFLLDVETVPRITRIHQANLKRYDQKRGPVDENTPADQMTAEFTLSIYFKP
ncbi:MAG TPA: type 4a pilus biogenesis protein PilO [Phycisphaerales bacterium]|nr:type 4a pilus biogenesis protein PilO [Phycisphaerales bacterium]